MTVLTPAQVAKARGRVKSASRADLADLIPFLCDTIDDLRRGQGERDRRLARFVAEYVREADEDGVSYSYADIVALFNGKEQGL